MAARTRIALGLVVVAGAAAVAMRAAIAPALDQPAQEMAGAATAFLASLTPELRTKAALPFDGAARQDWHYVPRDRAGVEFAQMDDVQRRAARALMRSALSSQGAGKVEEIMLLDAVLREMEKGSGVRRDPLAYSVAVFGTPGGDAWGWKLEGHHVSLNFTGAGTSTAVTPAFLGANPAEVRTGERAGLRVLSQEEDLARELLASLTADERRTAVLGDRAPDDILAVPGRALEQVDGSGLAWAAMNPAQRALVERLLAEFARNLRYDLAEAELARIHAAGMDAVRFAWMGSDRRGEGHYWRLSGPTFVIECDNTQNGANHVHTVWRDRQRDFGRDLLRDHREAEQGTH